MNVEEAVDYIEHHGVKGQRWGVRRNKSGGHNVDLTRVGVPPHPDHITARTLKGRHISTLSNAELKQLNQRVDLESKYRKVNPSAGQKLMNTVKAALSVYSTANSIAQVLNDPKGGAAYKYGARILGKNPSTPVPKGKFPKPDDVGFR